MNSPKQLIWHSRRTGVPLERAEALWRRAVRHATLSTGWVGNSEFWGAAMDEFLALLDAEQATLCSPRVTPLVRSQSRVWRLPLIALEDVIQAVSANWQRATGAGRRAA